MTGPPEHTPWWRPLLHATPRRAWMNDPNGLVRHGGRWHLYFQHHPDGVVWGPMSWGHVSSPDLVSWAEHPVAVPALAHEWVFSGCVVEDAGALVAVYTAVDPVTQRQTQALATSDDGGFTWNRHPANPVLDIGSTQFRDPKVFRDPRTGRWVMVVVRAEDLVVEVRTSPDLLHWPLASTVGPYPRPAGAPSGPFCWEMPDLVEVPVEGDPGRAAWVLLLSVNPGGPAGGSGQAYAVGDFDGERFTPAGGAGDAFGPFWWADHGPDLYAASTFAGVPAGEPPVWVGWMSNWAYADRTPTSPWRGAATLPRRLALRPDGDRLRLVQRPVLPAGVPADPGAPLPVAARARADVEVPPGGSAGLDLLVGGGCRTRVEVRAGPDGAGRVVLDRTASGAVAVHDAFPVVAVAPLPGPAGPGPLRTTLDVVVDASSVEVSAADGAASLTALVFPPPGARGLAPVASGGGRVGALTVHDLTPPGGRGAPGAT